MKGVARVLPGGFPELAFPAGRNFHKAALAPLRHADEDALPLFMGLAGLGRIGGREGGRLLHRVAVPRAGASAQGDGAGEAGELEVQIVLPQKGGVDFVVELVAADGEPVVAVPELAAHVGKAEVVHIRRAQAGEHGPEAAGVFLFRELAAAAGRGNFRNAEMFYICNLFALPYTKIRSIRFFGFQNMVRIYFFV